MQKSYTKILSTESSRGEVNRLSEYADLTAIEGNLTHEAKGESVGDLSWLEAEGNESEQDKIVLVAEEESEEETSADDGDAGEAEAESGESEEETADDGDAGEAEEDSGEIRKRKLLVMMM